MITDVQLTRALSLQYDEEFVETLPAVDDVPEGLIANIPIGFARNHNIIPFAVGRDIG